MSHTMEASEFTKLHLHHPRFLCYILHQFLGTPSLVRKSSSIRGRPSRNLTFGSHPSNSFAFEMSGFLWRGSSGVFSTILISTLGLISCNHVDQVISFLYKLNPFEIDIKVIVILDTENVNLGDTDLLDILREFKHCKFTWIPNVDWTSVVSFHKSNKAINLEHLQ